MPISATDPPTIRELSSALDSTIEDAARTARRTDFDAHMIIFYSVCLVGGRWFVVDDVAVDVDVDANDVVIVIVIVIVIVVVIVVVVVILIVFGTPS